MAFQSMLNGADCSTSSNPLAQLMKHSNADSSIQQDRIQHSQGGPSNAFRNARQAGQGGPPSMDEQAAFFRQQQQLNGGGSAFDMGALRHQLGGMQNHGGAWSQEMSAHQHHSGGGPMDMHNMEAAFAGSRMGGAGPRRADQQGQSWRDQFAMNGSGGGGGGDAGGTQLNMNPMMGMSRGGMMGGSMYGGGMAGYSRMGMSNYAPASAQTTATASTVDDKRFVELDEAGWKAQFDALEQQSEATSKGKGKAREEESVEQEGLPSEAEQEATIRRALDDLDSGLRSDEAHSTRFEELWNAMQAGNAPAENASTNADIAKWEEELMAAGAEQRMRDLTGLDPHEDALLDGFGSVGDDGFPRLGTYRFNTDNPFRDHAAPMQEGLRILAEPGRGSLADAALLFEAATARAGVAAPSVAQQQSGGGEGGAVDQERRERSEAWRRLGEAQAMNERETQAIRALEEAVRIDGTNLEALMSLSISYTNDGYDAAAHATLERYISNTYPDILASAKAANTSPSDPWSALNRVTDLFLRAARQGAASGKIDADIQIGLGVLFYSASSYEQARDCFATALEARPNDFLLWNRLGATLANGGKPEEAIEAYTKALELRPTFTRAIYNLSVSCLNLGAHHQAAEHLLAALALQATQTAGLPDVPLSAGNGGAAGASNAAGALQEHQESHNLWSTLRRIFLSMDRMDLAQLAHVGGDIEVFRKEGFEF